MTDLFLKIVSMSISASWLAAAVILLRFFLKKAPKWVTVLLWSMVAVRLMCPFTPESNLSRIPDQDAIVNQWADEYVGDTETFFDNREEFQTAVEAGRTPLYAGEGSYYVVTAPDQVSAPRTVKSTIVPLLSVLWYVGMITMGAFAFFSYWKLKSRVNMAIKVTEDVFLSEFIDTPFVLGIFRPRIYLPYHMQEPDSHHVIAHERMHIRRRDHWWKPLGFALLTIHWFNPVIWLSYTLLCRDIELACDEKVIRDLPVSQRADYSQALLNCSVHHRQIAACPVAFGEVGVQERVKNVLTYHKPAAWVMLLAIALCIVVAVCFLTDPRTPDSLTWLQNLDPQTVRYIEYINKNQEPASQYTLYSEEALPDAVTCLRSFHGTQVRQEDVEPVAGGGYRLLVSTVSGDHVIENIANVYLVIDGDYYRDPDQILPQHFDSFFYGTTYLPAAENQELGVSMVVEKVSPTGITVHFENYDQTKDLVLFGGNDYFLQEQVSGQWIDLPTLATPIFTTEAYSLSSIARHTIDWQWLYGRLRPGHYRIAKDVSVRDLYGSIHQNYVVYAEFDIPVTSGDWRLDMETGWFTPAGFVVEYDTSHTAVSGELYVNGIRLYQEEANSLLYSVQLDDHDLRKEPEIILLWDEPLPADEYRLEITIQHISPDGERELQTKTIHFSQSDGTLYMSPLVVTQKLTEDGLSASAQYGNSGAGYVFFDDMEEELLSILNALTWDDIIPSPGVDPHTVITLQNQTQTIFLSSDGENVELSFEGKDAVTIGNGIWAVKNQALNDFFTMINSYSPENSTYEIYNVAPLNELPPHYSIEEASIDRVVIVEDGLVLHNSEVWAEFWDDTQHNIPASVRCMTIYQDEGTQSLFKDIYDIEFDGEEYHYRTMQDGALWDISYRYLLFFYADAPENLPYDAFECFVLVNDQNVTWEQIQRSYVSSQSSDHVDHRIVHTHHISFPKQPRIPEAVQAELILDGQTIAFSSDAQVVHEIWNLISGAEWLGFEPATYFFGPRLMFLDSSGSAYGIDLDVFDDLCRYGGKFYDYGPGMDGDASINNLPKLLQLFGLDDWPEQLKQAYPQYFE